MKMTLSHTFSVESCLQLAVKSIWLEKPHTYTTNWSFELNYGTACSTGWQHLMINEYDQMIKQHYSQQVKN